MFPVYSTSVETVRLARAIKIFQRRKNQAAKVHSASLYTCKTTVGTSLYSGHAFGDAVDLMADQAVLADIAKVVIEDATKRNLFNRGKRTNVVFVIWNNKQWTKDHGISEYTGVPHTNHVHVGCSFSVTQRPRCAGGHNYNIPYLHGQRG